MCLSQIAPDCLCSLHLFNVHPTEHEGQLAGRKDNIVNNAVLARIGERLGLPRCRLCSRP